MLHAHPQILGRPEPHLLTPLAHLGYFARVDRAPYDPITSHLAARSLVADLPRGEEDYLDALRAYSDTVYRRLLAGSGARILVDKTPAYALIAPFVERLYPDAIYVVITRHPFAIFASYAEAFFDDDWDAAHAHQPLLERYVPALAAVVRRRGATGALHLRYEAVVRHPGAAARALCRHAGVPDDASIVEYGRVPLPGAGDPVSVDRHRHPVTTSIDRWIDAVAGRPDRRALLQRTLDRLDDRDLAVFGLDRRRAFDPVPDAPRRRRRRMDRHRLQRSMLLSLRRAAAGRRVGRTLRQVRFYCDVLLRESAC